MVLLEQGMLTSDAIAMPLVTHISSPREPTIHVVLSSLIIMDI